MTARDALALLFREAVKLRGVGGNVQDLQEARDVLTRIVSRAKEPCVPCKGVGYVPVGMGRVICVSCNGTGDKP